MPKLAAKGAACFTWIPVLLLFAQEKPPGGIMPDWGEMGAGHFIYIPAVLLLGIVIGWILGSRAAADAYAAELRRREERQKRQAARKSTAGGLEAS